MKFMIWIMDTYGMTYKHIFFFFSIFVSKCFFFAMNFENKTFLDLCGEEETMSYDMATRRVFCDGVA